MPERRLPPDLAQWIVQALARLTATYAILQGTFIVLGGRERWQSPSLATAMSLPGAPESWGLALLIAGLFALAGTFAPRAATTAVALAGIGAWSFFFALSLFVTLLHTPEVATTGVFVYSYGAVTSCVLAVTYWRSRR